MDIASYQDHETSRNEVANAGINDKSSNVCIVTLVRRNENCYATLSPSEGGDVSGISNYVSTKKLHKHCPYV